MQTKTLFIQQTFQHFNGQFVLDVRLDDKCNKDCKKIKICRKVVEHEPTMNILNKTVMIC